MPEKDMQHKSMNAAVTKLWNEQMLEWPLAAKYYASLADIREKVFFFGEEEVLVQFNPARIKSTTAKLDDAFIRKRSCFLCATNLPSEQQALDAGDYWILVNPYPIFPQHFTIPYKQHVKQQIFDFFADFLNLARLLDDFIVFYNGPQCGASAPNHLHFQVGTKHYLPLIKRYKSSQIERIETMTQPGVKVFSIHSHLRPVVGIESDNEQNLLTVFNQLYHKAQLTPKVEPMMNVIAFYEDSKWTVLIMPRKQSRPHQYYAASEKQLLVSPGTVEMGGIFITPVEAHFNRIQKDDVIDIFKQVSGSDWIKEL